MKKVNVRLRKLAFAFVVLLLVAAFFVKRESLHVYHPSIIRTSIAHSAFSHAPSLSPTPKNRYTVVPNAEAAKTQNFFGYCLRVPVLLYHHIQPESLARQLGQTSETVDNGFFDQQMGYLVSHGYHTITAPDLTSALRNHSNLPPKSIVVTIDDGYVDDYTYVLPVIEKYHVTINLMIATGLVDNSDFVTWDELRQLKNTGLVYFTDHTWSHYAIGSGSQNKIQYEIETAKQQLEQNLGQPINIFTYPYGSFSPNAIGTLQADGFIGAFSTIPGSYQCDSSIMTLHRTHVGNASLSAYGL